MQKDVLVNHEFLNSIPDNFDIEQFYSQIMQTHPNLSVLDKAVSHYNISKEKPIQTSSTQLQQPQVEQKNEQPPQQNNQPKQTTEQAHNSQISQQAEEDTQEFQNPEDISQIEIKTELPGVKVRSNYDFTTEKKSVGGFVEFYKRRYEAIRAYLASRQEMQNTVSINRIGLRDEKETISIIGMIKQKNITKNDSVILEVEDVTGSINVIITKNNKEAHLIAKTIILDETIGVVGTASKDAVFANKILIPDVPLVKELKKAPEEEYAMFISDIHVGSKYFLHDNFVRFIKWLNGEIGNEEQKALVKKVKYLFCIGDLVDGVGIYPGQEKELNQIDIKDQYAELARLLAKVPNHISIIMCPGNHDATRLEEPQPPVPIDIAPGLYALENAIFVMNPCIINIGATEKFTGIDVMMYHGYSFDYFISNVDEIRNNGGYDRGDLVMKFLLQRRHLCPTHGSTTVVPDPNEDPMVLKNVPDLLCTGHIHKCAISNYRNVTLISSSCWQDTTPFQKKLGHHPEPCRVPIINLKTREARILRF